MIHKTSVIFLAVCSFFMTGCGGDKNFNEPNTLCSNNLKTNITIGELKDLYIDQVIEIQENLILEAIVVSSDKEGNIFSVLHCQDAYENPKHGIQLEIDLQDSHLFYPPGTKIGIKLKGLYLGKSKGLYKIGGVLPLFGNLSVGRLPAVSLKEHVFVSCDAVKNVEPSLVTIPEITDILLNTLITINHVEFLPQNQIFAEKAEETERILRDCEDNEMYLLNSGYSDFQDHLMPTLKGNITGVLIKDTKYQLVIRTLEDINFTEERCEDVIDEFTSTSIFISEIADPDNNSSARFVELYNAGSQPLSLKGWSLQRYTNANTELSSKIDLSSLSILQNGTIVLAANAEVFTKTYGIGPDMDVGSNSAADSNGDDNLVLVDPFENIIDVFGIVGEDGTGTSHEFEDGRALRKPEILEANPTFTPSEWSITNDTGGSDTLNDPQMAPEDFTPGNHN